ncbi:MAG: response regulator [Candidatus Omnitrophica bacterium]|nr:response regulator [Candidatus Omnitrophota bacterium]
MSRKILLIEDNEGDQFLIKELFDEFYNDWEFSAVVSGEEGIKKVELDKPDIVITDTQLPGMDGFETCKRIKDLNGDSVKVVVMTGLFDSVNAIKAREMGADDYCVKTSNMAEIARVLKAMIG